MRVLVTGSRLWADGKLIHDALVEATAGAEPGDVVVVHGACSGADWFAEQAAFALGMAVETHPADWSLGRRAGPLRNNDMVALGADICLAFILDSSPGASHCVASATRAGIPVRLYTLES